MKFHEILQFFKYSHLPDNLQVMSKPFYLTAMTLAEYTPEQLEKEIMFIEDSQADSIFSILRSLIDTITPANPEASSQPEHHLSRFETGGYICDIRRTTRICL